MEGFLCARLAAKRSSSYTTMVCDDTPEDIGEKTGTFFLAPPSREINESEPQSFS